MSDSINTPDTNSAADYRLAAPHQTARYQPMPRPGHLFLVTDTTRPPTPPQPQPNPWPPLPPTGPRPKPDTKRLPPKWRMLAREVDTALGIERVMPWLEIEILKSPPSRRELHEKWNLLASTALQKGLAACLIYPGPSGKHWVRIPRWFSRPYMSEPDPTNLEASEALSLPAAGRVIRTAACCRRTLTRLWAKQLCHPGPH